MIPRSIIIAVVSVALLVYQQQGCANSGNSRIRYLVTGPPSSGAVEWTEPGGSEERNRRAVFPWHKEYTFAKGSHVKLSLVAQSRGLVRVYCRIEINGKLIDQSAKGTVSECHYEGGV